LNQAALIQLYRGDFDDGWQLTSEALQLSSASHNIIQATLGYFIRSQIEFDRGYLSDALNTLDAGLVRRIPVTAGIMIFKVLILMETGSFDLAAE
jgi:hypothetical protein